MALRPLALPLSPAEVAVRLDGPGAFWLDGSGLAGGAGRFSYLGADPVEVVEAGGGDARPLDALARLTVHPGPEGGPWPAGARRPRWVGHIAYEAAAPGSGAGASPTTPPLRFARHDAVLAHDARENAWWIASDSPEAEARLLARVTASRARPAAEVGALAVTPAEEHAAAIRAALEHIARGDIYQLNLARRWSGTLRGEPLALALAMRDASPVPFGFYQRGARDAVIARTMETFVAWDGRRLVTRPIKGTAATGAAGEVGAQAALLASDKERAEHVMIVDLMRNDLGRVARPGTVTVEAPMVVEPYARLAHLVSTVGAETRDGVTLAEVMEATFPPGSVTGTPKRRAMELIAALEGRPRGVYTGAVGFVDDRGGCMFAVAIRTAVVAEGQVTYFAGGGIVEASDVDAEVAETDLKARAFLDAVDALRERTGAEAGVGDGRAAAAAGGGTVADAAANR